METALLLLHSSQKWLQLGVHLLCGVSEVAGSSGGARHSGGDSSSVQDNLKNVQQICGTSAAFAAVLVDETVVTWGNPDRAGESSKVQDPFSYPLGACSGKKMNMLPARHLQFLFPHYKL